MTGDDWVAHATQIDHRGEYPRYTAGPVMAPADLGDGAHVWPCTIAGHCSQGDHDRCWQADGEPTPDHDVHACPGPHRLRCRCPCHDTTPQDHGVLF